MVVSIVKENNVKNLNELKIKASIVKHVECSEIRFIFSNKYNVENIPYDIIINMLDNMENRL